MVCMVWYESDQHHCITGKKSIIAPELTIISTSYKFLSFTNAISHVITLNTCTESPVTLTLISIINLLEWIALFLDMEIQDLMTWLTMFYLSHSLSIYIYIICANLHFQVAYSTDIPNVTVVLWISLVPKKFNHHNDNIIITNPKSPAKEYWITYFPLSRSYIVRIFEEI